MTAHKDGKSMKTENTPAPAERSEDTAKPVTELGHVHAEDDDKALREMAGIDGKVEEASEAQQNVYHGLKDVKAHAKDPTKPINPHADKHPHRAGPGSDY